MASSIPQPITRRVEDEGLLDAIRWSCRKLRHKVDRPGMNARGVSEKLDDNIMGDTATVAVLEYLRELCVPAVAYDTVRTDDFRQHDPGWDVAVGRGARAWAERPVEPREPVGLVTASVRSSRLPQNDSLSDAIRRRDFKIFAPPNRRIEDCITADVEIQVYYDYRRTQLAERTITPEQIDACVRDRAAGREISERLAVRERFGQCFLTAWNFKDEIVRHSRTLAQPRWSSFGKAMWFAPLRLGKDMTRLTELL
jgi:hypothetical protein